MAACCETEQTCGRPCVFFFVLFFQNSLYVHRRSAGTCLKIMKGEKEKGSVRLVMVICHHCTPDGGLFYA